MLCNTEEAEKLTAIQASELQAMRLFRNKVRAEP